MKGACFDRQNDLLPRFQFSDAAQSNYCDLLTYLRTEWFIEELRSHKSLIKNLDYESNMIGLQEAQFPLSSTADMVAVYTYVVGRMKTDILSVCPGVFQENVINLDIDYKNTVIEKQGNSLYYRSTKCSRIFESLAKNQLCNQCEDWIKKGIEEGYSEAIDEQPLQDEMDNSSLHSEEEVDPLDNDMVQEDSFGDEKVKLEGDELKSQGITYSYKKLKRTKGNSCEVCGEKFKGHKGLLQHMKTCDHQSNFFQCDQCERLFSSGPLLKQHKHKHEQERKTHRSVLK